MDTRRLALEQWLTQDCQLSSFALQALPMDASFRRYFRTQHANHSFIAMDAPPPGENCAPFVAIAKALAQSGVQVPQVFFSNIPQGFLLLSDFGNKLLLNELTDSNAVTLYQQALHTLVMIQSCRPTTVIPPFTAEFMHQELHQFKEWFLERHLGLQLTAAEHDILEDSFGFIIQSAVQQPQAFMHRDYHAANLMLLPENKIGVLDFQDAFIGPITYDLVSLLRDCYIAWPATLVTQLALSYREQLHNTGVLTNESPEEFLRWFDLMGMQRHLKAILTFSRKKHRDNNASYLRFIPRALGYIEYVCPNYPELSAFEQLLQTRILPALQKVG